MHFSYFFYTNFPNALCSFVCLFHTSTTLSYIKTFLYLSTRHDMADKLLSWRYTTITHSLYSQKYLFGIVCQPGDQEGNVYLVHFSVCSVDRSSIVKFSNKCLEHIDFSQSVTRRTYIRTCARLI